ncbi:hypothetical protein B4U80_13973 [Leptotrombidium deliense]|uniref:Uncharacterized protein n=1 Tax=Leptotrombidium deliense TaxID=299467 RepID=A0A443S613_9ACAR|nr:hypothetical protein B4U80_13973 [Leptotrombidium deliense]
MHFLIKIGILLIVTNCFPCAKAQFDRCKRPKIDALSSGLETGELFIYNNEYFFVFDIKSHTIREQRLINKYWPDVKTPIDAASTYVENGEFVTFFVKGHVFWMYRNKKILTQNSTLHRKGNISVKEGQQITGLQILKNFYAIICDSNNEKLLCQIEDHFNIILHSCEPLAIEQFKDKHCDALAFSDNETLVISGSQYIFIIKSMEENVFDAMQMFQLMIDGYFKDMKNLKGDYGKYRE